MPDTRPIRIETLIANAASRHPARAALIFGARRWTYGQLYAEMERRAALLVAAGLMPGDVVVTAEPVSDDVAIAFLACCRAGLVMLPLSPNLTAAELVPIIVRSGAKRLLRAVSVLHPAVPDLPVLPLALPVCRPILRLAARRHMTRMRLPVSVRHPGRRAGRRSWSSLRIT